jgi:AraC-like DNA-binding protein
VGYACGYFDQAHFIKDFARFAGMTPGQFRVEENPVAELLIRNQTV